MNVAVLYVGSSLPASLRRAERDIDREYHLGLRIAAHNCTLPLTDRQWSRLEEDLAEADIVFVIHVTDAANAPRIGAALARLRRRHHAVIVINCLGELMRHMHLGEADFSALWKAHAATEKLQPVVSHVRRLISWMPNYTRSRDGAKRSPVNYLRFVRQLPGLLRLVPPVGILVPVKHYLTLFCYFLQPTPANIRSMILYAVKHCMPGQAKPIRIAPPEAAPLMGIYHPDSASMFDSFDQYRRWYESRSGGNGALRLDRSRTIGLLLLRPQVVSGARRHYDALIRAIESEGLAVLPVLSTFMDNRQACGSYFVEPDGAPRVSQFVSLTGFSFVGGPAMNDSEAAVSFLKDCNRPYRSAVSLEMQTIDDWTGSMIGLNPVQTAMQVAIPELDGATEPFIFGGLRAGSEEPEPLDDRCRRIARRLANWNRLRSLPRSEVRLAFLIFCFPPNKGNLGTAAGMDVFPSLWEILRRLQADGYEVNVPPSHDALRELLLADSAEGSHVANVAHRLPAEEYRRLCPYVGEIENEWGPAPGAINSLGSDILIHGVKLGNVFLGVQPAFGYEGDPMRLMTAQDPTPHHGFMGLYTYLGRIFRADALVHVGTHGALEFMPGKQAGLSSRCWPDRLIGETPNLYLYSVNNPSEGSIAKRRSYAELVSYLTPPLENAGLYKELASLKELIAGYRRSGDERQREQLFAAIQEAARSLHLDGCESVPAAAE